MSSQLYFNGYILTMEQPLYVEAVFVENGKIIKTGALNVVKRYCRPETEYINLEGKALLPAFIDAHSHLTGYASSLLQVPLDGAISFAEIERRIREFICRHHIAPGEWVQAKGYDHNILRENSPLTRSLLDQAAPDNPLVVHHQSGHTGVLNSHALQALGINANTVPPSGGRIGVKDGELTGYLEENAFIEAVHRVPMPSLNTLAEAIEKIQDKYASYGITTVQEGMMADSLIGLYQYLLQHKKLFLDVVGYVDGFAPDKLLSAFPHSIRRYHEHFRIGGYKIFLDGSPQAKTAWMCAPYADAEDGYAGYPALDDHALESVIRLALRENQQLLAHCNGDAAVEQYLSAYQKVRKEWQEDIPDIRPVIIHAQFLRPDQMKRVKQFGMIPSFFVAHVYHWGDTHIKNVGYARASDISAAHSALAHDILFTFHQDAPVIDADMIETVWCAVNRLTKSGVLLGPSERIPTLAALKAVTLYAAYQYFEEKEKGSIREGKRADFVILDQDPLRVELPKLREIQVLQTVKDGKTVYRR